MHKTYCLCCYCVWHMWFSGTRKYHFLIPCIVQRLEFGIRSTASIAVSRYYKCSQKAYFNIFLQLVIEVCSSSWKTICRSFQQSLSDFSLSNKTQRAFILKLSKQKQPMLPFHHGFLSNFSGSSIICKINKKKLKKNHFYLCIKNVDNSKNNPCIHYEQFSNLKKTFTKVDFLLSFFWQKFSITFFSVFYNTFDFIMQCSMPFSNVL